MPGSHFHVVLDQMAEGLACGRLVEGPDFEILDNYASVCGVDPEPMDKAAQDRGSSAEKLLLINKARGTAAHKGGKVVNENDAADQCILGWIRRATYAQLQSNCCSALAQLGATSKACP